MGRFPYRSSIVPVHKFVKWLLCLFAFWIRFVTSSSFALLSTKLWSEMTMTNLVYWNILTPDWIDGTRFHIFTLIKHYYDWRTPSVYPTLSIHICGVYAIRINSNEQSTYFCGCAAITVFSAAISKKELHGYYDFMVVGIARISILMISHLTMGSVLDYNYL